jgi:hypothetical protein
MLDFECCFVNGLFAIDFNNILVNCFVAFGIENS